MWEVALSLRMLLRFVEIRCQAQFGRKMAMILPQFKHQACKELSICAELVSDDKALLQWVEDQPFMLARYKTKSSASYAALILGGYDPKHVHIDLSSPEMLRTEKPVKTTCKISDIKNALEHLAGQRVHARIRGEFWVPGSDLPVIIRSMIVKTTEGGVTLKMVGGEISVEGTPISKIEWSILDSDNLVAIRLMEKKDMQLDENYLADSLRVLEAGFEALVLKRKSEVGGT